MIFAPESADGECEGLLTKWGVGDSNDGDKEGLLEGLLPFFLLGVK